MVALKSPTLRGVLVPVDGAELSVDVYLPDGDGPFPTLVSPTPYRKDDYIGAAWRHVVSTFVARGYAHVVADFRGLGSSSGAAAEAMSPTEGADGAALVEWSAAQPWSTGSVGMYGISYGGISALRTATARPPHLRAIAPMYAATDFYSDFVYPGGCLNCLAVSIWTSLMLAMELAPPMLHDADGRWQSVWRRRVDQAEPWILAWLEHPDRDRFWIDKAIPVERIDVPTFLIGGWRDLYPEAMVRTYERLRGPRKLWMGPWSHVAPDASPVAPTEFVQELCRWFDRHLIGGAGDDADEPPVTIYVQGAEPGWRHEDAWPIARTESRTTFLALSGELVDEAPAAAATLAYTGDPTVGVQAGLWDVRGTGLGLPLDQRLDEERSLTFTGRPVDGDLEITGSPVTDLTIAIDEGDDAHLVVKLSDVAPDGGSSLITTGWLKLRDNPSGVPARVRVPLWATSYRVAAGHRLRIAVACSDFPRIWPTRVAPRLRLHVGGSESSSLTLPVVPPGGRAGPLPAAAASPDRESSAQWRIERDQAGLASVTFADHRELASPGEDGGLSLDLQVEATARPDDVTVTAGTRLRLEMPTGGVALVTAESQMSLTRLTLDGRVEIDGEPVLERRWEVDRT